MKIVRALLLLLLAATSSFANWTGSTSEPDIATVDGVEYYQIGTPEELAWFAEKVNAGDSAINAQLTKDIVLWNEELSAESEAPHWTPIGLGADVFFGGIFDGQNHKITGLYINDSSFISNHSFLGLFGYLIPNSIVKNLQLENAYILAETSENAPGWNVGGVAGFNHGLVENVSFNGTILLTSSNVRIYSNYVGGIVGISRGHVSNATVDGSIECQDQAFCWMGGITGMSDSIVEHSVNNASVIGFDNIFSIGGIVGGTAGAGFIDSCTNNGNVKFLKNSYESPYIGGIVGHAVGTRLRKCVNNGQVEFFGKKVYAGGIAGMQVSRTMDSCTNNGEVKGAVSIDAEVGGVAGRITNVEVNDVENTAEVYVESEDTSKVGGIVGYTYANSHINAAVNNKKVSVYATGSETISYVGGISGFMQGIDSYVISSVNLGSVYADSTNKMSYVGGIIGIITSSREIAGCVNQGDVTGVAYVGGVVGYAIGSLMIDGCVNRGNLNSLYGGFVNMGGIVGFAANNDTIRACTNDGNIRFSGDDVHVGGIVGCADNGVRVVSCTNNGDVSGTSSGYVLTGGVIGEMVSASAIERSQNNGDVLLDNVNEQEYESPQMNVYVGGLLGASFGGAEVANSVNQGKVSAKALCPMCLNYAGGIAGYSSVAEIRECANKGQSVSLLTDGYAFVGGLVGYLNSDVVDSYNTASVIVSGKKDVYAGGIAGLQSGSVRSVYSVADSVVFSSDEPADSLSMGILVGWSAKGSIMNAVYGLSFDDNMKNIGNSTSLIMNVDSKTKEEMQTDSLAWLLNTEAGSDTNSRIWSRGEGYPIFADDLHKPVYQVFFNIWLEDRERYSNFEGAFVVPDVSEFAEGKELAFWVDKKGRETALNQEVSADMWLSPIYTKDNRFVVTFKIPDDSVFCRFATDRNGLLDDVPGNPNPLDSRTFSGWFTSDDEYVDITYLFSKSDTVYAQYDVVRKISFRNYDGTGLQEELIPFGEAVRYNGSTPKKPSSVKYDYIFGGWDKEIHNVVADEVYTAVFDSVFRTYRVAFMNDSVLVGLQYVKYGYSARAPAKVAREGYVFVGWDVPFDSITGPLTVNAMFKEQKKYQVSVYNKWTGMMVENGKDVAYEDSAYTLPRLGEVEDYIFLGWYDTLGVKLGMGGDTISVNEDISIVAYYAQSRYHVSFYDDEGNLVCEDDYDYGTIPEPDKIPTKKASDQYTYSFAGWNYELAEVTENARYNAVFDVTLRKYTVRFLARDNVEVSVQEVAYGMAAKEPAIPQYKGYVFVKWDKKFSSVKSDMTVTAVYEKASSSSSTRSISSSSRNPFRIYGDDALVNKAMLPQFSVEVMGRNLQIAAARVGSVYALMDVQGHTINSGYVDAANFNVAVPNAGTYLVRVGSQTQRINVK